VVNFSDPFILKYVIKNQISATTTDVTTNILFPMKGIGSTKNCSSGSCKKLSWVMILFVEVIGVVELQVCWCTYVANLIIDKKNRLIIR
jgi:hypothetical protein